VLALLERMAAGSVDAIAFTSAAQVERLVAVGGVEWLGEAVSGTRC